MTKVIIGAGPAGLYTAIKLRKAGITDIIVFDPRAGNYTRPGHLNGQVFIEVGHSFNLHLWRINKRYHIKDLERVLYDEALKLGIKIENKRFLRLHQNEKQPGVFVDNGVEEFIAADFVFDCTGTRREVIKAVNSIIPESPLKLTTFTKLPVTNHFLAYIQMDKSDWLRFKKVGLIDTRMLEKMDALTYAQTIIQLRKLGWKEFMLPRCYGVDFTKDKVCLYLHAPETLAPENYDNWVQTVLECYTKPISYKQLPTSTKPRFLPFPSSAQELKQVAYKRKNLPNIIALGDAQIDFDYILAHGIEDGLKRIDALFEHMDIFDKQIYYFDSEEYQQKINTLLQEHKNDVIKKARETEQSFINALEIGLLKFRQALILSNDLEEQDTIRDFIKEIEAHQCYEKATKIFKEMHNSAHQIVIGQDIHQTILKLNNIQALLLKSAEGLEAPLFIDKHKNLNELLLYIALSWKEVGNTLFNNQDRTQAIESYEKAIEIYGLPDFSHQYFLKELPIYSNLVIAYLQSGLYSEAIVTADSALLIYKNCKEEERPAKLFEKVIFNLIKALCAQAQDFLSTNKIDDAKHLHSRVKNLIHTHKKGLTDKTCSYIEKIATILEQELQNSSQDDKENVFESTPNAPSVNHSLDKHGIFKSPSLIHEDDSQNFILPQKLDKISTLCTNGEFSTQGNSIT